MVTPELSGHTTGKLDHPNPEEAEENDFKCNFMKMMETFKEEMKTPLKKKGKEKKSLKKLINPSKKTKRTQQNR